MILSNLIKMGLMTAQEFDQYKTTVLERENVVSSEEET
jgi:hypothetical protein